MPFSPPRSRPEAASKSHLAFAVLLLLMTALQFRAHSAPVPRSPIDVANPASPSPPVGGPSSSSSQSADSLTASREGADTSSAQAAKSRTDSLIVVKHSFEHREQIITGSVIMSCLMLMMVAMNNYNPR